MTNSDKQREIQDIVSCVHSHSLNVVEACRMLNRLICKPEKCFVVPPVQYVKGEIVDKDGKYICKPESKAIDFLLACINTHEDLITFASFYTQVGEFETPRGRVVLKDVVKAATDY